MAQLDIITEFSAEHPLDIVEQVIEARDWPYSRGNDDELGTEFRGKWCDLQIQFAWSPEIGALHTACTFDFRIPEAKRNEVHNLLALINDRLWLGHFCIWQSEGLTMFRHTLLLRGATKVAPTQIDDLLDVAMVECERFYPAFQFVVWGGKNSKEAMDASIIEPIGKA